MGDIVVRHGQYRQLRDRTVHALYHPGALVETGKVAVKVSGISFPGRDLTPDSGKLPQRFAIVRHIGHDYQHVHVLPERQVFGAAQGKAGRRDALDRGTVGQTEEHGDSFQNAAVLETLQKEPRGIVLDAHGGEYDAETLVLDARLTGDLRGDQVVRHAAPGKNRKFLPAHERVHDVYGRYPGLDDVLRIVARRGIYGKPVNVQHLIGRRPGHPVQRVSPAVEHPAQHLLRDHQHKGFFLEPDPAVTQ